MFLDHTQRRSTVGRTPLDEWSARPEESYRLCCVVVCDLETSRMGAPYIYIYDISRLRVKPWLFLYMSFPLHLHSHNRRTIKDGYTASWVALLNKTRTSQYVRDSSAWKESVNFLDGMCDMGNRSAVLISKSCEIRILGAYSINKREHTAMSYCWLKAHYEMWSEPQSK